MANIPAAYHSVMKVKTVPRVDGKSGDAENAVPVPYAQNISLQPQSNTASLYADGRKVLSRATHNGYTGSCGFSSDDDSVEQSSGAVLPLTSGGRATVNNRGLTLYDTYYEYINSYETGSDSAVKVWVLAHTWGPAEENHATDEDSLTFGQYVRPIDVKGDVALADEDGAPWADDNGIGATVFIVKSYPGDAGYSTFQNSVPLPVISDTV